MTLRLVVKCKYLFKSSHPGLLLNPLEAVTQTGSLSALYRKASEVPLQALANPVCVK